MPNTIDMKPEAKDIKSYLSLKKDEEFKIPSYQRAYSWNTEEHCDKLLEDLFDYIENNGNDYDAYFFGNLITVNESNYQLIIDGQQRTTTFLLLLKALHFILEDYKSKSNVLNEDCNDKIKDRLKEVLCVLYKIDKGDINQFIKNFTYTKANSVLCNESMNETDFDDWKNIFGAVRFNEAESVCKKIPYKKKDNKYTNFFRNLKFFYYNINKKLDENFTDNNDKRIDYLSKFITTLLDDCKIIQISSNNINQAVAIFNSLNSKGCPLEDADVICSLAYSKCTDITEKTKFQENWKKVIVGTENTLSGYFSVTSLLQQFMYHDRAVQTFITNKSCTEVSTPGLRNYYTMINKALLCAPIPFSKNLLIFEKIWEFLLDLPVIRLLLKMNNNAHLFLASYFYNIIKNRQSNINLDNHQICDTINQNDSETLVSFDLDKEILPFAESLIKLFTLLELVDFTYSSSEFKVFLFQVNDMVVKNDSITTILDKFSEQISRIVKNCLDDDLKGALLDYRDDKLVYLNEYLFAKEKNLTFYIDRYSSQINIEHIMPQSKDNQLADIYVIKEEDYLDYLEKLGNKILLETTINNNISADNFKIKKNNLIFTNSRKEYKGYKQSKYQIASALSSYPKDSWLLDDIDVATEKAANRICNFILSANYIPCDNAE
jgi:hypothetical protein